MDRRGNYGVGSRWLRALFIVLVVGLVFLNTQAFAASKTYQVVFKAGSHGTINGQSSDVVEAEYDTRLNMNSIYVYPEKGYYFTGWSPEVETQVTQKATYVAQYARIIEEAVYRVNYRDTYGNELATQKIVTTNAGIAVTENALKLNGYTPDAGSKSATVAAQGTELTFVYTSAQAPTVVTETETVIVDDGTIGTGTAAAGAAAGTTGAAVGGTTTATDGTTVVTDGTVTDQNGQVVVDENGNAQQEVTTITEDETPLANNEKNEGFLSRYGVALVGVFAVIVLGTLLVVRKLHKK